MKKKVTFRRLFEPINIGKMTVNNRIVMAPMGTGLTTKDGLVTERGLDYYEARAKEGVTIVDKYNKELLVSADTVVLAVGAKPDNSLFLPLKDKEFETHLAGDCWHPGKITQAVSDGFRLGYTL